MDKQRIIERTSPEKDTLQETPEKSLRWTSAKKPYFPYSHKRPLPRRQAQKAIDYINVITKDYPFQLRYAMALPLWERFSRTWCDSGDIQEALRGI